MLGDPDEFPFDYLPRPIQYLIDEVARQTGAARPLIFAYVASMMALSVQRIADIWPTSRDRFPLSLYFSVIAGSGEGKSAVFNVLGKVLRDIENEADATYKAKLEQYKIETRIHDTLRRKYEKQLDRAKAEEITHKTDLLRQHLSVAPIEPISMRLLISDASIEALQRRLKGENKWVAMISDEAAGIVDGRLMQTLSTINSLWGGSDLQVDRVSSESFTVVSPRLSMCLALQPGPFEKFKLKKGEDARDIGLLARIWWSYPATVKGSRHIANDIPAPRHVPLFHQKIREFIQQSVDMDAAGEPRYRLYFSEFATSHWLNEARLVEREMGPKGNLEDVSDVASKFLNNVARLAGVFHLFCEDEPAVSVNTFKSALEVGKWYINQFKRLFVGPPRDVLDAQELEDRLRELLGESGANEMEKNKLRQRAPNELRKPKRRFDAALELLVSWRRIRLESRLNPRTNRETVWIVVSRFS